MASCLKITVSFLLGLLVIATAIACGMPYWTMVQGAHMGLFQVCQTAGLDKCNMYWDLNEGAKPYYIGNVVLAAATVFFFLLAVLLFCCLFQSRRACPGGGAICSLIFGMLTTYGTVGMFVYINFASRWDTSDITYDNLSNTAEFFGWALWVFIASGAVTLLSIIFIAIILCRAKEHTV